MVSGTPVQNSTDELYSLLHFLQLPGVAATHAAWTAMRRPDRLQILQEALRR